MNFQHLNTSLNACLMVHHKFTVTVDSCCAWYNLTRERKSKKLCVIACRAAALNRHRAITRYAIFSSITVSKYCDTFLPKANWMREATWMVRERKWQEKGKEWFVCAESKWLSWWAGKWQCSKSISSCKYPFGYWVMCFAFSKYYVCCPFRIVLVGWLERSTWLYKKWWTFILNPINRKKCALGIRNLHDFAMKNPSRCDVVPETMLEATHAINKSFKCFAWFMS